MKLSYLYFNIGVEMNRMTIYWNFLSPHFCEFYMLYTIYDTVNSVIVR